MDKTLAKPSAPTETPVTDEMKGGGAATTEIEALRARIVKLEDEKAFVPNEPQRRMVALGAGFLDQFGRPVMVPYTGPEPLGDRLVRQDFADIGRAEFERDEAVQAIGREVGADVALAQPLPEPSPSLAPSRQHAQFDTRTGLDSLGPSQDAQTLNHVDRIAAGFDALDRAEVVKRHKAAFGKE